MTQTPAVESFNQELALGHYLTLRRPNGQDESGLNFVTANDGWTELRFQNFWINQNARWRDPEFQLDQTHSFLPFGFSGITVNRNGDNVDASLVFPNNALSRQFVDLALREQWTAVVRVCRIENLTDPMDPPDMLYRYVAQVASGTWNETELVVVLNSVIDAVAGDVPQRSLRQDHIGQAPVQAQLGL